ncbi:hypothetical protein BAZSYMA_V2ACONTIG307880_0 [Bathymodiolus azoricus thioautotrophic gill symbiont]|uniref:Uncharacterized protein n=1 Tax=Bathymodiolus azoricus thioautotrophic gill symbiont TaxID=235205 RepID=A0A1H6J7C3_9GAMM|nr:hypothetical protein BAZSYMA_V2ACONTIG307880_0 [Bathymodiolus azoricus thioautotrophic gill symbiont]
MVLKKMHSIGWLISRPLKTHPNQTKTTHFANHPNQQNCFFIQHHKKP